MSVTVSNLLTAALALMGADLTSADYTAYAIPSVNLMLADLFSINNALLALAGQAELTAMPSVSGAGEAVPYRDELTRNVMPYGLARDLGRMDANPGVGGFTRIYDQNKESFNAGVSQDMLDCYGADGE